ncbi:ABC transporter permease [Nocardioides nanhaiensis]|uniref:ABC transporter permease n=1 Tax=Nocardioides nanhaiensis TaxID=1476871 RepID=A0ABP8VPW6_9ACTN
MSTSAPTRPATTTSSGSGGGFSTRRTVHMARWNAVLLTRNKLALFYATALPLAPLLLVLAGADGDTGAGASAIVSSVLVAGLFPVYYNVLSQFVNRRDELVLKRMRTGEVRDSELLAAIALPGVVVALAIIALGVPIMAALGQPWPLNPLLVAVMALATVLMFAAFAYWTAAWTRNAEAAQLTSLPIIMLAVIGQVSIAFPDTLREIVSFTPGAAITELVRVGWFGLAEGEASDPSLAFGDTWAAAGQPLLVLVAWTAIALDLMRRSMRWEPRS